MSFLARSASATITASLRRIPGPRHYIEPVIASPYRTAPTPRSPSPTAVNSTHTPYGGPGRSASRRTSTTPSRRGSRPPAPAGPRLGLAVTPDAQTIYVDEPGNPLAVLADGNTSGGELR